VWAIKTQKNTIYTIFHIYTIQKKQKILFTRNAIYYERIKPFFYIYINNMANALVK